jgi:hypothetical protein
LVIGSVLRSIGRINCVLAEPGPEIGIHRGWRRMAGSDGLPADFDAKAYLAYHRDVAAAGVDAATHYLTYGKREGRPYRREDMPAPYDADGLWSIHNHDFMSSLAFQQAYARGVRAAQEDYRWHWRVHIGLWAAASALHLPGDFVECGVNRGFLSSAIMEALDWNALDRTYFLLDTFGGLDERFVTQGERDKGAMEKNANALRSGFYTANADAVRANFSQWKNVTVVEGAIPETLGRITAEKVAFVHIDMNCAPPEIAAIEYLWPRLVPGAFVLLDDYAYHGYEAQKAAMDAFAESKGVAIASLPTGQGLLIRPPH